MESFTKKEIEFLKENANSFGAYICSIKLNRKFSSVISKLRREKIPYKYKKTDKTKEEIENLEFKEDENLYINFDFNTTKTPKELAYFLGFFWADGTINREKYIHIEITSEDGNELLPIFSKLSNNFYISYRKREGRKEQMSFFYKDKMFSDFLKSKGKYPRTVESHKKILEYIPEKYKIYFIRGLIDGDGCFSKLNETKTYFNIVLCFEIAGRYEQDWDYLIKFFKEKYNLELSLQLCKTDITTSSRIRTHNSEKIINFVKILYNDKDEIYLKRKYNKIKEYIEYREKKNKEHLKENGGYYITINDEPPVFVNKRKLSQFCRENNLCYENINKLANKKIDKYKNIKITKTF
jgi:hypothetical protein